MRYRVLHQLADFGRVDLAGPLSVRFCLGRWDFARIG